jgi:hypothetical protein
MSLDGNSRTRAQRRADNRLQPKRGRDHTAFRVIFFPFFKLISNFIPKLIAAQSIAVLNEVAIQSIFFLEQLPC